jgi:hypothetical protein
MIHAALIVVLMMTWIDLFVFSMTAKIRRLYKF